MKSLMEMSGRTWNSTPYNPFCRSAERARAVSRSVFDGIVPELTAAPPGLGARSTRQTVFPK